MNIESIKNYNQKILAVLGTLVVILLILLIAFVGNDFYNMITIDSYNEIEEGILSEKEISKLQKENLRKQLISYQFPQLIDTLNSIYIIPVSHVTLNEPENAYELVNKFTSSKNDRQAAQRYSRRYQGAFNNLIVYDKFKNKKEQLFKQRVNFDEFDTEYFSDEILLVIKGSEEDTHRNGLIDMHDRKTVFIYSFSRNKLTKMDNNGLDIIDYQFIGTSKNLMLQLGAYSGVSDPLNPLY